MDVLGLTSFAQIRAVLSVYPEDLPDEVMVPYDIATDLQVELADWLPAWQTIRDQTGTPEQNQARDSLLLWAKYWAALQIALAAPNFIYSRMGDGENQAQRELDSDSFEALREGLARRANRYREAIEELLGEEHTTGHLMLVGRSSPDRDPVKTGRT